MRARLAFVLGSVVLAPPALADHSSLHATASGEVATTDNLFATGSGGNREPDMFLTLRPGVLFAYDAPQMIHDFTGEVEILQYVTHGDRPLITGRGGWKSLFLVGPRTQLTLSITTATGLLNAMAARSSADETITSVIPSGKVEVQQADTAESLSYISSKHTRIIQGVYGRYGFTDDGGGTTADTREAGANLGFERNFEHDTVGIDAAVAFLQLERIAPQGALMRSRFDQQVNPRATLQWRHDINRKWSTTADGGVVFVNPVGTDKYAPAGALRRSGTFGIYGAQLSYADVWGRAVLSARRNVSPNLFLAQNTVDDTAHLQVALPLPWLDDTKRNPKMAIQSSLGLERTQIIDATTGSTAGSFEVARADVALGWTPTPGQTYGVRYEAVYQSGDRIATMEIPSFYRNTLYVTFSLRYPERIAAQLPKRSKSLRSDRKDMMPGGGEPVVPDILEEGQQE